MNRGLGRNSLRALLALAGILASATAAWPESRWKMQYMYDEDKSSLAFVDIQFSSPERGIAVGVLQEKRSIKPVALVTSDGGTNWTRVALPDEPRSLFLLNDSAAWLVGESGIWFSAENGRTWKRLFKNKRLVRVCFVDRQHGYASGAMKTLLETVDGGEHWLPVPAAKEPSTSEERTTYNWIDFWTPEKGLVVGRSSSIQRNERIPLWMDTDPEYRRELPAVTVFLQTTDAGKTWKISQNSIFGTMTRFVVDPTGRGVGLIEYSSYGRVPSEVLRLDERTKSFTTVYHEPSRYITDVAMVNQGPVFAAGIEVHGKIAVSPIPQKVKVLESLDMKTWTEMKVDYRAAATRVHLAQSGANMWLATDTGMILKLANE